MRTNKLRGILDKNEPSLSTHIHTVWPSVVELVGHTNYYDYVEFVGEYGPYELHDLDNLARAAELHGLGIMLKVDQEPRGFLAQRAIGSGFQSVLFADCKTVEDFRSCVEISRPDTPHSGGSYGVATRRFSYMGYGGSQEYVNALEEIVVAVMIEKGMAVDNIDEILEIEGIDMIQWGPADYSMNVGKIGQKNAVSEVEKVVIKKSLNAKKHPRAEINTADDARYYLDLGVRHFCVGTDVHILHNYWEKEGDDLRKALDGS